jgi:hypothetical protein
MDLERAFESYKEFLSKNDSLATFAQYLYSLRLDLPVDVVIEHVAQWGICEQEAYEFLKESE